MLHKDLLSLCLGTPTSRAEWQLPHFISGQAIDPAAETFKKQQLAYTLWAEQQIKNAERQLGTAGR